MQVLFLNFLIRCGTNRFWANLPISKVIKYASFSNNDWPSIFPDVIKYISSNIFQAPIRATLGKQRSIRESPAFGNWLNFSMGVQCYILITILMLHVSKFCQAVFWGSEFNPKICCSPNLLNFEISVNLKNIWFWDLSYLKISLVAFRQA